MTQRELDQHESWLARNERDIDQVRADLAHHAETPWHTGFTPINADMIKRLERMETLLLSIGKWVIGILAGILTAISAILVVAWRILEAKP